jgi:hypothetical protein
MSYDFLQEITEARLFRYEKSFKDADISEVAEVLYITVLALQIVKFEDPKYAQTYARQTLGYGLFGGIKSSSTDLHNLISVVYNPDKYSSVTQHKDNPSLPEMQLRSYLKYIAAGNYNENFDMRFLKNLESFLNITNGSMRNIRRIAQQWKRASNSEKTSAANRLYFFMKANSRTIDIMQVYMNMMNKHSYLDAKYTDPADKKKKFNWAGAAATVAGAAYLGYKLGRNL